MMAMLFAAGCFSIIPAAAEEAPKKVSGITGTFMQPWLYQGYTDKKMDNEFARMKELGIDTVIMGDTFTKDGTPNGKWSVAYPSKMEEMGGAVCTFDAVDRLLVYCKKYGMKLYVGVGLDSCWWDKDLSREEDAKWLENTCRISAKAVKELYDIYVPKYGDTFGGYYWVYEIWNHGAWNLDITRESYAKALSNGFNIVLDAINKVDPSKPLLFSPFASYTADGNGGLATKENCCKFYTRLFELTNFRKIDAILPMDNIGGGGQTLEHLEEWTRDIYYQSVRNSGNKLQLWSNCESFVQPHEKKDVWTTGTVDRFVQQLQITGKYCEKIVSFSWNHYMSPNNTIDGFDKSFHYYLEHGKLETGKPTLPEKVTAEVNEGIFKAVWTECQDDFGIARYIIEKMNTSTHAFDPYAKCCIGRKDNQRTTVRLKHSMADRQFNTNGRTVYRVYAVDCTGNHSDYFYIVADASETDGKIVLTPTGGEKGYYTEKEAEELHILDYDGKTEKPGGISPLVLGICSGVMVLAVAAAVVVLILHGRKK